MLDSRVLTVFKTFQREMKKYGKSINLPKNTPVEKTYQFRAISKFLKKVDAWGLDSGTMTVLIQSVVEYGKKNRLLKKGTMLLNMDNILDICYSKLDTEVSTINDIIDNVKRANQVIGPIPTEDLLKPIRIGGYSKLYCLVDKGDVDSVYLALSVKSFRALQKVNSLEREKLPSNIELFRIRNKILRDQTVASEIKKILQEDLNTAGVV